MQIMLLLLLPLSFIFRMLMHLLVNLQCASSLVPSQVLLVNLVTSITLGLALAAEPAEPTVMTRPPRRPNKRLMGKLILWRCFFVCHAIVVLVIGLFYWAGQDGLSLGQQRAEAFAVLVGCQVVYFVNCRFLKASTLHPRVFKGNWLMYPVTIITVGLMVSGGEGVGWEGGGGRG